MPPHFPDYSCYAPRGFQGLVRFDERTGRWQPIWTRARTFEPYRATPEQFGDASTPEGERQRAAEAMIAADLQRLGLVPPGEWRRAPGEYLPNDRVRSAFRRSLGGRVLQRITTDAYLILWDDRETFPLPMTHFSSDLHPEVP